MATDTVSLSVAEFRGFAARVFEALGMQDVVAKSVGSANNHNMIKATFDALSKCSSPRHVAGKRGKKVGEIVGRRSESDMVKDIGNG